MKKFYYTLLVLLFSVTAATAQEVFNHLSAGLSLGLGGIGVELATPVTEYMQLRAGMTFVPNFKYNTSLDVEDYANGKVSESEIGQYYTGPTEIDFQGKPNIHDVKLLLDVYPSRHAIFHVTVGAYFGNSKIVSMYNKDDGSLLPVYEYNTTVAANDANKQLGLAFGDYLIKPDASGNAEASIRVQAVKPYLGIGLGRAVPSKRISFKAELGALFWGKPKVYDRDHKMTSDEVGGDEGKALKTISKIPVYPMLNFVLYFKVI
jgi:hypothetical protein